MGNQLTAENFREAFASTWKVLVQEQGDAIKQAYAQDLTWTKFMLKGGEHSQSMLASVADWLGKNKNLMLKTRQEWYTADMLLVSEDCFAGVIDYPHFVDAIIEHENGARLEEEMWKLLQWRSPLKIIIGYDYTAEHYKKTGRADERWIDQKYNVLRSMYVTATERFKDPDAQYLLIYGQRETDGSIHWYHQRIDQEDSKQLPIDQPSPWSS